MKFSTADASTTTPGTPVMGLKSTARKPGLTTDVKSMISIGLFSTALGVKTWIRPLPSAPQVSSLPLAASRIRPAMVSLPGTKTGYSP